MNKSERYIHFDWAMKRMLRNKANFAVLEGLLTVLLGEKITIIELLESEANQPTSARQIQPRRHQSQRQQGGNHHRGGAERPRKLLLGTHPLWRGQSRDGTYRLGRNLSEGEQGDFYQHRLFQPRQRQRLPLSRLFALCGSAHGR